MASDSQFQIGATYNFDVYPIYLLGNVFSNVTIVGIMNQDSANREIDTVALHKQVYPTFQAFYAEDDPSSYNYLKVQLSNGNTYILGLPWIKTNSVVLVERRTAIVTIPNVNSSQIQDIVNALAQNGFNDVSVKIK